jgi:hypothetical protein
MGALTVAASDPVGAAGRATSSALAAVSVS